MTTLETAPVSPFTRRLLVITELTRQKGKAMKSPMTLLTALAIGLLLPAHATAETSDERAAVNVEGTAAAKVKLSTMTATVEAIDMATRLVTLSGPDGSFTLQAGEQVRNLAQVKAGDKVTVEYYEGLVAEIVPSGAAPKEVDVTAAMVRAPAGERPAGAVGKAVSATVVIEHVDTVRNVVFFKGPLGKTRVVKAMKPEFTTLLKKLKPGDQVNLTYFEALAVSVSPAGK
jgi:antitoxin (DNA-binding transcriptional repressor) of toxin-antitoxin stability system